VKELPLLFSAPMVRAYLDGLKTQTRRIVKDTDVRDVGAFGVAAYVTSRDVKERGRVIGRRDVTKTCPYGGPGDKLWAKETWGLHAYGDYTYWNRDSIKGRSEDDIRSSWEIVYAADATSAYDHWRPSIFMPRWASRITLEISAVRLERLQAISEEDAIAEGVEPAYRDVPAAMGDCRAWRDYSGRSPWHSSAWASYRSLWGSINGPESWSANPWVWVISFPRLTGVCR
jgi:hypothetical protein